MFCVVGLEARTDLSIIQAKNKSAQEGKKIYVFFTADWCLPCQMMKEGAYKDQRVNFMLLNGMIPVLADEQNSRSKEWFTKYKVSSLPVTLVLDQNGNVLERLDGFKSVESILGVLEIYSKVTSINSNLNNVPIVFRPFKRKNKIVSKPYAIPEKSNLSKTVYRESTIITETIVDHELAIEDVKLYPTIYGIQLNSFNSIYDATEYQEYINEHFSKEAIILTADDEKVYKVIFTCKSLNEAKRQIKTFRKGEVNCFIRIL